MAGKERVLAFRITAKGITAESKQIAQLDAELARLGKTRSELLKKARAGEVLSEKETKLLSKVSQNTRDLQAQKQKLTKTEANLSKTFKAQAGSMEELRLKTSKLIAETNNLNLKTKEGRAEFEKNRKQIDKNKKEIRDFDRSLSGSSTLVGEYSKGFTEAFAKIGGAIIAVTALYKSLGGVISLVTEDFAEFETGQINVQTLLEKTDEQLSTESIQLMKRYGIEVADMSKSLFDAVSAGVEVNETQEFMATSAQLAIGGVTDLAVAVDGITSVINGYGKSYSEANQVAAAFFSAQKFGKTTVGELATEIGQVVPIANQLDISYQELLATYAELTKQGIKTTLATTAIRATMVALQKPTEQSRAAFKKIGVEVGASAVKSQGFFNILTKISQAVEAGNTELTDLIPNVRALTGVGALGTRQLEEFHEILAVVNEDYGKNSSLARAVALQQDTVNKAMDRVKAQFDAAKISAGQFLAPVIKGFANLVAPIQKNSMLLAQQNRELNLLVDSATSVHTTEESRLRLIEEMNRKYPTFLENLDQETVSNEELKTALEGVNEEFEQKIKLAIAEELYAENAKELAELYSKELELIKSLTVAEGQRDMAQQSLNENQAKGGAAYTEVLDVAVNSVSKFEKQLAKTREEQEALLKSTEETLALIDILDKGKKGGVPTKDPDGVTGVSEFDEISAKDQAKIAKEIRDIEYQMELDEEAFFQDEMGKLYLETLEANEAIDKMDAEKRERLKAEHLKSEQDRVNKIVDLAAGASEALGALVNDAIVQGKLDMKQFAKLTIAIALDTLEKIIQMKIAEVVAKSMASAESIATWGVAGALKAAAISGAVSIAFNAAKAFISKPIPEAATGMKIPTGSELPYSTSKGDNTLVLAKPGEVILNRSQQLAMGGDQTFRNIGVPGFASGGLVTDVTQSGGVPSLSSQDIADTMIGALKSIPVMLNINALNEAESELSVILESGQV